MTTNTAGGGSRGQDWVIASDGWPALLVSEHVKEKEFPIERMISIFNTGMHRKWERRYYIDLFAGPGRCVIRGSNEEVEGSPMLAVKSKVRFTDYFFGDKNLDFLEALRKRIGVLGLKEPPEFHSYHGDADRIVGELTGDLPAAEASLGLAVLDAWGWDFSFKTLNKLAEGRRLDLVINFPVLPMKRNWGRELPELDRFMNSNNYKESFEYAMNHENPNVTPTRVLLDYYKEQLEGIGYRYVNDQVEIKNSVGIPQYHLIFASRNERGADFWEKVTRRQGSGQIRMGI